MKLEYIKGRGMIRLIAENESEKNQIKITMNDLYNDAFPNFLSAGIKDLTEWDVLEFTYEEISRRIWNINLNKQEWEKQRAKERKHVDSSEQSKTEDGE